MVAIRRAYLLLADNREYNKNLSVKKPLERHADTEGWMCLMHSRSVLISGYAIILAYSTDIWNVGDVFFSVQAESATR